MKKSSRKVGKSFSMVLQIGISVLTPIFLCVFIGVKLDQYLGTKYWTILLMVLGIMAAFRNVYLMVRTFYKKDLEREQKGHQFIQNEAEYLKKNIEQAKKKEQEDLFSQWKEKQIQEGNDDDKH